VRSSVQDLSLKDGSCENDGCDVGLAIVFLIPHWKTPTGIYYLLIIIKVPSIINYDGHIYVVN
jgi:hypothetical protein